MENYTDEHDIYNIPRNIQIPDDEAFSRTVYAVYMGRTRGFFPTWREASASTCGYSCSIYKKFDDRAECLKWWSQVDQRYSNSEHMQGVDRQKYVYSGFYTSGKSTLKGPFSDDTKGSEASKRKDAETIPETHAAGPVTVQRQEQRKERKNNTQYNTTPPQEEEVAIPEHRVIFKSNVPGIWYDKDGNRYVTIQL